jgi:protein TonB
MAFDLPFCSGMRAMRPKLLSLAMHAGAIALLILISSHPGLGPGAKSPIQLADRHVARLVAPPFVVSVMRHGGGGGGAQDPLPPSRGHLPKLALQQLTPPSAKLPDFKPVLAVEPTLIAPPDVRLPAIVLAQFGDPLAGVGPASNGPGKGGGIGRGTRGGIGDHDGPGYGDDDGGGIGGVGYTGGVTAPSVLYRVEPEFSEEARKAKFQGIVVLAIEIGEDGKPRRFRVLRGLGLGLDEKAVEAVSRWKFKPALRNGRAVPAPATIEVNFRLL